MFLALGINLENLFCYSAQFSNVLQLECSFSSFQQASRCQLLVTDVFHVTVCPHESFRTMVGASMFPGLGLGRSTSCEFG